METLLEILADAAKGHPLEVAALVFCCVTVLGVMALWKLFGFIKGFATQDDIASVAKHADEMETLNAAQHRQMTEGNRDIINGFREDFKLNDLKLKEMVGGLYERVNPMDQRLSKLEGEHDAFTAAGHCATVRSPDGSPHG